MSLLTRTVLLGNLKGTLVWSAYDKSACRDLRIVLETIYPRTLACAPCSLAHTYSDGVQRTCPDPLSAVTHSAATYYSLAGLSCRALAGRCVTLDLRVACGTGTSCFQLKQGGTSQGRPSPGKIRTAKRIAGFRVRSRSRRLRPTSQCVCPCATAPRRASVCSSSPHKPCPAL